jgi:hypothetical protein
MSETAISKAETFGFDIGTGHGRGSRTSMQILWVLLSLLINANQYLNVGLAQWFSTVITVTQETDIGSIKICSSPGQ